MGIKIASKSMNPQGYKKYSDSLKKNIIQKLFIGSNWVKNSAIDSITNGPKSGIQYPRRKGGTKMHTASAPGEAPATDTGFLRSNIVAEVEKTTLTAIVESRAKYSKFLEFGTRNMKPRPLMFPALEENKPKIRRLFAKTKGKV